MNAPFGIIFLKKAELYNIVRRLDKQADADDKNSKYPNTWPIEKRILKWSYYGHKHLGTPFVSDFFKKGNNKLRDWGLVNKSNKVKEEYRTILKFPDKIRENMVVKGFAEYCKESEDKKAIILNKEGLLVGEVIFNVENRRFPIRWIYRIYSLLIDYIGAWILLLIVIIPTIAILIINLINLLNR